VAHCIRGGSGTSTLGGRCLRKGGRSPEKFRQSYVQICSFDIKSTYNHSIFIPGVQLHLLKISLGRQCGVDLWLGAVATWPPLEPPLHCRRENGSIPFWRDCWDSVLARSAWSLCEIRSRRMRQCRSLRENASAARNDDWVTNEQQRACVLS